MLLRHLRHVLSQDKMTSDLGTSARTDRSGTQFKSQGPLQVATLSIYSRCKACLDHYLQLSNAVSVLSEDDVEEIGIEQETLLITIEDACVRFKA